MSDINKFTTKEVLNKVLLDSSGNAVNAFSHTTQEAFNAALDNDNSRLNVNLVGGTIGGDVTINGDLTVNGDGAGAYDEIVNGQLVTFRDDASTVGTNDNIVIENDGAGDASLKFSLTGATDWFTYIDNSDSDKFKIRRSTTDHFTIDESGNVGIGTDSPDNKLHVNGGHLEVSNGGNTNVIINSALGSDGSVYFREAGGMKARVYNDASADALVLTDGADTTTLTLAGTNATFAGDVGIGMTPTHNLNVYNDGGATSMTVGKYASGKTVGFIKTSADTNGYFSIQSYKSQGTTLGNIVLNGAGGNVGIGTNAPAHKFHVNGISTTDNEPVVWLHNSHNSSNKDGTVISTTNDGDDAEVLHVRTNNTTYNNGTSLMLVRGDGNVGIGTDSPTSLMHIQSNDSTTNAEVDMLTLQALSTGTTTTGFGGAIKFQAERNNGVSQNVGKIRSIAEVNSGSNISSGLSFETGTFGTLNESMRITYDGKVGIGISSINGVFTAYGTPMTAISAQTVADIFGDVQQDADKGGGIGLGGRYITDSSSVTAFAEISGVKANNTSANYEGEMVFKTRVNGGNLTERMRLDTNSRISLSNNDSGTSNTVFGKLAGASIDAGSNYNTFIGENVADASLNDATNNIGVGYYALSSLTTGDNNVVMGSSAGINITGTSSTVLLGHQAGNAINSADAVGTVAVGYQSLKAITNGGKNVAVGYLAGSQITTGDSNVALGHQAMDEISTGDRNIAIGHNAIGNAQGGATSGDSKDNIAIGFQSQGGAWADAECLKNTSIGSYSLDGALNGALQNTALGYASLGAVTQGDNNVAVGMEAGDAITTGSSNTIIGASADVSASGSTNQIVIGQGATGVADNSVTLGNTSVTKIYMNQNGNGKVVLGTIEFDASQATLSTNVNTLDDYEEGDYDATMTCSTSGTITLEGAYNRLAYVKVGRSVTVTGLLIVNAVSSPSGYIKISLPFAIGDGTDVSKSFSGAVHIHNANSILSRDFVNIGVEGESFVRVYVGDASGLSSDSAEGVVASTQSYIGITYQV